MKGKSSVISGQGSVLGVLRLDAALPCGGSTPRCSPDASLASRAQSGVKPPHSIVAMLGLVLFSSTTYASSLVTSSVDGGGKRTTSANYMIDGSIGRILQNNGSAAVRNAFLNPKHQSPIRSASEGNQT